MQIKQSETVINLGPGSVVTQMRAQTREWPSSSAVTHAALRGWRGDNERKWLTVVGFRVSGSASGPGLTPRLPQITRLRHLNGIRYLEPLCVCVCVCVMGQHEDSVHVIVRSQPGLWSPISDETFGFQKGLIPLVIVSQSVQTHRTAPRQDVSHPLNLDCGDKENVRHNQDCLSSGTGFY